MKKKQFYYQESLDEHRIIEERYKKKIKKKEHSIKVKIEWLESHKNKIENDCKIPFSDKYEYSKRRIYELESEIITLKNELFGLKVKLRLKLKKILKEGRMK